VEAEASDITVVFWGHSVVDCPQHTWHRWNQLIVDFTGCLYVELLMCAIASVLCNISINAAAEKTVSEVIFGLDQTA